MSAHGGSPHNHGPDPAQESPGVAPWTRIARADDVPVLEGRSITVAGRRIAVFRLLDGWAATDAVCPHAGGPLQDGIVADSCVTCPLHQRRFDLRTGAQIGGTDVVAVHEVVERDGALWVRLAEGRAGQVLEDAA